MPIDPVDFRQCVLRKQYTYGGVVMRRKTQPGFPNCSFSNLNISSVLFSICRPNVYLVSVPPEEAVMTHTRCILSVLLNHPTTHMPILVRVFPGWLSNHALWSLDVKRCARASSAKQQFTHSRLPECQYKFVVQPLPVSAQHHTEFRLQLVIS